MKKSKKVEDTPCNCNVNCHGSCHYKGPNGECRCRCEEKPSKDWSRRQPK